MKGFLVKNSSPDESSPSLVSPANLASTNPRFEGSGTLEVVEESKEDNSDIMHQNSNFEEVEESWSTTLSCQETMVIQQNSTEVNSDAMMPLQTDFEDVEDVFEISPSQVQEEPSIISQQVVSSISTDPALWNI